MSPTLHQTLRGAALLGGFALLGTALVAITRDLTEERIGQNRQAALLAKLHDIVPEDAYDNALVDDTRRLRAPDAFGTDAPVTVYRARKDGEPVAAIVPVTAPDGYNGPIRVLVGVYYDGTLAGVRVLSHKETPGLGDVVEASKSDWIKGFEGRSLGDPPREDWRVRRDGGVFDQLTGATITPRAIVGAIRRFLIYFSRHRERFFAGASGGEPSGADQPAAESRVSDE